MNDRFTNGFIAGTVAGTIICVINYIFHQFGIVDLLYLDWVSALLYGYRHETVLEAVVGQAGKLFFSGLLGSLFAFWLIIVTSKYLFFKGIVFGIAVWFGAHAAATLLKLSSVIPINSDTVFSYKVEAVIFGIVLAESMRRLSGKEDKSDGD
ncbi:MAG: hypothetical protein DDT31_01226 [Syntrophomonadaceae bacterium]|nr:hypothetical protein [Bacillota bacterium]